MGKINKKKNRFEIFASEYVVDLNGTRAAIAAGYAKRSSVVRASQLLTNRNVVELIQKKLKEREDRVNVRADDVLKELMLIARVDIREAFNENGELKPIKDIPEDVARAMSGVDVDDLFEGNGKG